MKMRKPNSLMAFYAMLMGASMVVVLGASLVACKNKSAPVAQDNFSASLIGRWEGTVGGERETMSINADGTFSCILRQRGFIATMLYPRKPGKISGTWKITGNIVTLTITGESNERPVNSIASSTIISFNDNEVVLQSGLGERSSFERILAH
jgi:hypothetical protein